MKGLLVLFLAALSLNAATVAHYKFDIGSTNAPLYEMTDSSGNGHHGRVLGQELFELTSDVPPYPGVSGAALDLRGRLDYAVIPHHRDFAPTGDWTIELFFKVGHQHQEHGGDTNVAGSFQYLNTNLSYTIMAKKNDATPLGSAWAFHYQPHSGYIVFTISRLDGNSEVACFSSNFRDGKWHHIAISFSSGDLRAHADGFNFMSSGIGRGIAWGEGPIFIGAWARQDAQFAVKDRNFDGMLDEIRFSDAALSVESFVVNFEPLLFPPIPMEAFQATEVQFEGESGKIYRIEQLDAATGTYARIGYAVGEGGPTSFFFRNTSGAATLRVVADTENPTQAVAFTVHAAIELRLPTSPDQLYMITVCEQVNCPDERHIFLLGDGAKMSHFERAGEETAFYRVERY
jgi:hypothetical protein